MDILFEWIPRVPISQLPLEVKKKALSSFRFLLTIAFFWFHFFQRGTPFFRHILMINEIFTHQTQWLANTISF